MRQSAYGRWRVPYLHPGRRTGRPLMAARRARRVSLFESAPCGRCGGSGSYSYCQRFGSVCFQCGGRTWCLTKRGAAAQAFYSAILPTKLPAALAPGDAWVDTGLTLGGDTYSARCTVVAAPTETGVQRGESLRDGVMVPFALPYVAVLTRDQYRQECSHHMPADKRVTLLLAAGAERDSLRSIALGYQATLTQTGRPAKRARRAA